MSGKRRILAWVVSVAAAASMALVGVATGPNAFAAVAPCDPTVANWPDCLPTHAQMAAATRTQRNGAFFWTGGVMAQADEMAQIFGGTTLEGALDRAGLALPQMGTPRSPEGDAAWTFASRSLALQASGIAFVLVGEPVRPNNVWASEEFPTLQANPNVDCVIQITERTGDERVIYTRDGVSESLCRTQRAIMMARMACPVWQRAGWPRGVAGQNQMIEWPYDPSFRQGDVLYGGEPRPSINRQTLYSIAPTHTQSTPADSSAYVHSTPVLQAYRPRATSSPQYFYLYLDAEDAPVQRLTPEDIGCQSEHEIDQLQKRDTDPPSADPSVIRVGSTYYSVESHAGAIYVRSAPSAAALISVPGSLIWSDPGMGEIWAPELTVIGGHYYVYFSAGQGVNHRMYVIDSDSPTGGYTVEQKLNLPDDKWAIDGAAFTFNNQLWFVWSGWEGDTDGEQSLFLAKMQDPTTPTGPRTIISQPREGYERIGGGPYINEGPEPIKDPNGQLHIVYSTNHSWQDQYCLAEIRLRAGGDPTYVWDWYKSNGCLFGSNPDTMMAGWSPTTNVNGPGHHSFVLLDGDINTSPPAGQKFPLMYHAVAKGTPYSWENRRWYAGGFTWWDNISYSRQNVPGDNVNTGYSLGFFEDPNSPLPPPPAAPGGPGRTTIHNQDPSVIRVGQTYYSVESDGGNVYSRAAPSIQDLANAAKKLIWSSPKNMPNVWAPELVKLTVNNQDCGAPLCPQDNVVYAIYFASGDGGGGQRMYYTWSSSPDHGFSDPVRMKLPDDKWAVDGTAFYFNKQLWFAWSGWEGDSNVEQNIYLAKMSNPSSTTGKRFIISQPREAFERVVGNPFINEAPEAIKDPNGQLHIVYSANGSWSDQYCIADLRLRAGGDPTYVWDWYKSNGCIFGSNRATIASGWDPTLYVNGPGHHSFVLLDGDINTSPPAGPKFPLMYHAVPKGTPYSWANRMWFTGSFCWWGNSTYSRQNVPGDNSNTGWGLKFFE